MLPLLLAQHAANPICFSNRYPGWHNREMLLPAILLLLAPSGSAQPTVIELLEEDTLSELRHVDETTEGVLGVAAIDLKSERRFSYHGDTVFPQASSIKIPILIEMYRQAGQGKFHMSDRVTLKKKDIVGGSGHLRALLEKGPQTMTLKEVAIAMIESSDNTATNYIIRILGMDAINRNTEQMGFTRTRLERLMMDDAAVRRDDENISTPNEMAGIVEHIYRGRAVSEEASREMIGMMKLVKASFRKVIPEGTAVASKPGGVPGVRCESGVVYLENRPFVLSVMTTYVPPESDVVERAVAVVYKHFTRLASSNGYGHKVE